MKIGVLGSGTMGRGIAQVAATAGHPVVIYDSSGAALAGARESLQIILDRLEVKGRLSAGEAAAILSRITFAETTDEFASCGFVFEAIVENLNAKKEAFSGLEEVVSGDAILATNTSSLSVTSVGSFCREPGRVVGAHFFNPVPLMDLVEVVAGLASDPDAVVATRELMRSWGKTAVIAKDTPGFIVNRVARPFYGESIRILEEGIADVATIDWALREVGKFRMGPFQLMDLIGNDVNLAVTESVFEAFFYDPRFKPSFTQKRLVEAGRLGRKSGRGYYDYCEGAEAPEPDRDTELADRIFARVVVMLMNEAIDAVFMNIATARDVDLAMTRGVNYPQGLLQWANDVGLEKVAGRIEALQDEYGEDRYRPNPLLKRMVREGRRFFDDEEDSA